MENTTARWKKLPPSILHMRKHVRIRKKEIIMKKVICKVEYDTDVAELVAKKTVGAFGDPAGYEEGLYKMPDGKMFLYGKGGEASVYAEETIKRISAAKADEWQKA